MPDLERVAGRLAGERLLAADTEAAGYHRFLDRLCLLQLSTRDTTWIVDTIALGSLNPLGDLFEQPGTEVIFHDADYDLRLLDRDFGIRVRGLFDTQIAARLAGSQAFGLASVLATELGVDVEKKFQRADWARRPLPRDMLEYAAMDTRYLPALRDLLRARLEEMGRLEWAEEEFRLAEQTRWDPELDEEEAYLRIKGARDVGGRSLAALRELHEWRDSVARERDVAPFRVVTNDVLVQAATAMVSDAKGLASVKGLSPANARRYGRDMLEAVERARAIPADELPERPRQPRRPARDPEVEARVDRLRRARDQMAERLELERGFLMPRAQLEAVARAAPASGEELAALDGIRRWQVDALGDALLGALSGNGEGNH